MSEKRLTELNPVWVPKVGDPIGIRFDCPACDRNNAGGVHSIRVYWKNPEPPYKSPNVLWDKKDGDSFDSLTLHPSIDGTPSCKFHGWITGGKVTW